MGCRSCKCMEIRSLSVSSVVKSGITVGFGFTLSKGVDNWSIVCVSSVSSGVYLVVWVSSNSGGVWISRVGGYVWGVYTVVGVVEDSWVSFGFSFTLGDEVSSNWVMDIWVSSVGGVWGNILYLVYLFDLLGKFVLLLGELDGVGIFWYSWYGSLDNWYYWLDNRANNMSSICVVDTMDWYTSDVAVNELRVSFWLSKSDGHKGKQSNKAEHR